MQNKIGILGFGVVGKSALKFFQNKKTRDEFRIDVWDQKTLDAESQKFLTDKKVQIFDSTTHSLEEFIQSHDYIIPSPGVNLNDFYAYKEKIVCELDLFADNFKKTTIAITGSLGKTTTTKLLGKLTGQISKSPNSLWVFGEKQKVKPFVGGNVGLGMLEFDENQDGFDLGVLEISSFQLEFSKYFAPHIAILTNCYPNHLDRHKNMNNYLQSKLNLIRYQSADQFAVISEQFLCSDTVDILKEELRNTKSHICFTFTQKPDLQMLKSLKINIDKIFYKNENQLVCFDSKAGIEHVLFDLSLLPEVTFIENWIQVITTLYLLNADMISLLQYFKQNNNEFEVDDHHHRVEYFATIEGVDFYDDSKATVIQSTLAATKMLAEKGPVILILGGLGKGVDRSSICHELSKVAQLKKAYCFGPESAEFSAIACKLDSLEEIVLDIKRIMRPGDQVVLSPSGTSFDFYKNYKERGQIFKNLVTKS